MTHLRRISPDSARRVPPTAPPGDGNRTAELFRPVFGAPLTPDQGKGTC